MILDAYDRALVRPDRGVVTTAKKLTASPPGPMA